MMVGYPKWIRNLYTGYVSRTLSLCQHIWYDISHKYRCNMSNQFGTLTVWETL
jgi:hypothetical protein